MRNSLVILLTFGLLAILTIVTISILAKNNKKKGRGKTDTDFKSNFILGLMLLPVGIVLWQTLDNPGFIGVAALGLTYILIGLVNKDKWDKK